MKKPKTNADYLRSMTDEQLAAAFMIFRPSDHCFEDENRNYISLANHYFKHYQDCFCDNLAWLKQPYQG